MAKHRDLGEKVRLVDMQMALVPMKDFTGGLHPNERGYKKMAEVWFANIQMVVQPLQQARHGHGLAVGSE